MLWVYHISVLTSALGIIVSIILYLLNKDESFPNRLLAFTIFCISISSLFYGFYFHNEYLQFPHLWRAPVFLSLLIPPSVYLYIRSVLKQQFIFKATDILFLIPAILYTLNFIPFYVQSADEKKKFIELALKDPTLIVLEVESWIHFPGAIIFRFMYGLILVSVSLIEVIRWNKKMYKNEDGHQNNDVYKWLLFFSLIVLSTYVVLTIEYAFQFSNVSSFYHYFSLTVSASIVCICMYLLLRPNILYGVKGWKLHDQNTQPDVLDYIVANDDTKFSIPFEQGVIYKQQLEDHLQSKKPFRKSGYTIRDLAVELSIPSYQLSIFINQEYGKNFNELINEYRVRYLEEIVKNDPANLRYTLDALGKMAGFNSRSSFISAVKRYSGKTPSEFLGKRSEIL